ncbi:MAG TPA: PP2C family protein-serine/threonine phosphatase [Thermoanaerobaculia bacterium]|jgi:serine phosphatase RsbU (regulator of sigma subunit)
MREPLRVPGPGVSKLLRRSLISAAVGIGITFLATFSVTLELRLRLLMYGALSGFFINLSCYVLGRLFGRWMGSRSIRNERVVLAGVYFVGGWLGFAFATAVAASVSVLPLRTIRMLLPYFGLVSGGAAIVVGLLFYTFGVLQERLRESVERLKEHEFAEKELELARSIQRRLLPPRELEGETWRLAARNVAARFVAGDFYDVFPLRDDALGVVVADVSGKGIGASLIMASVKAVLPFVAAERSVDAMLRELNRKLVSELGPREFVALAYVRFESDGRFTLANAGLPDPYVLRSGVAPRSLGVPGPRLPLGLWKDLEYRSLEDRLEPGEKLLLFTDGLPEAPTAEGGPIGYPALERLLDGDSTSPGAFLDGLLERLRGATAPVAEDDWTVLALERKGSGLHLPH